MKRRRSNKIKGLEDLQGVWRSDADGICSTAVNYFSDLFQSSNPTQIGEITCSVQTRVSHEDNSLLTAPVTEGEIQEAAF
ncbi:hypothetical protein FF2_030580 [Malus domestica]